MWSQALKLIEIQKVALIDILKWSIDQTIMCDVRGVALSESRHPPLQLHAATCSEFRTHHKITATPQLSLDLFYWVSLLWECDGDCISSRPLLRRLCIKSWCKTNAKWNKCALQHMSNPSQSKHKAGSTVENYATLTLAITLKRLTVQTFHMQVTTVLRRSFRM